MLKIIKSNNSRTNLDLEPEKEIQILISNKDTINFAIENNLDLKQFAIINIKNLQKESFFENFLFSEYGYVDIRYLYQPNTNFSNITLKIPASSTNIETKTLTKTYYISYEGDPIIEFVSSQIQTVSDSLRTIRGRNTVEYKNAITIMQTLRQVFNNEIKETLKKLESIEWLIYRVYLGTLNKFDNKEVISKLVDSYTDYFDELLSSIEKNRVHIGETLVTINEQIEFFKNQILKKQETSLTHDQEIIKTGFNDLQFRVIKQLQLFLKIKAYPIMEHIKTVHKTIFDSWKEEV